MLNIKIKQLKIYLNKFLKIFTKFKDIFLPGEWEIIVVKKELELSPNMSIMNDPFIKLSSRFGYYYADPFIYKSNNKLYLICEEFSYFKNKGSIVLFEIDLGANRILPKRLFLEENYHLSFPYIFTINNVNYLIPESSENGTINSYKIDGIFTAKKSLICDNINGVDTVLYKSGSNIFLFTTLPGDIGVDLRGQTQVFVSKCDEFPGVLWSKVPLLSDTLGRGAGNLISQNGLLYRLSQISLRSYGEKIAVSQIEYLSSDGFKENFLFDLNPKNFGGSHIHTLNIYSNISVFDRKRVSFLGVLRTNYGRLLLRARILKNNL